jgi:hypothetical protein
MSRKAKSPFDIDQACDQLVELGVKRNQFIKARVRVSNAAGALIRRALGFSPDLTEAESAKIAKAAAKIYASEAPDTLPDDLAAIAHLLSADIATSKAMAAIGERHQAEIEKAMRKLARQFPVWQFAKTVHGLSDLGLAVIIAAAGPLDYYPTPSHLCKRLGLAPIAKDGVTRAASSWRKQGGLSADDWKDTGPNGPKYSPRRRAQIYSQVGTMIIGGMGKGVRPLAGEDIATRDDWSYYQKEFVRRLRHEAARDPAMARPVTKDGKESFSLHARFRAQRVVEQRLIKHLWQAWRRTGTGVPDTANGPLSSADYPQATA